MLLPLLYSCDNKENRLILSQLDAADSLCSVDPNKASLLIKSLEADVTKSQNSNYYRWLLLNIKATDKADMPLTSDSIMKKVVEFYQSSDYTDDLIEAYYYLGRTYIELKDYPHALTALRTAFDISEQHSHPKPIVAIHICAQLSGIYLLERTLQEALEISLQEYDIAKRFGLTCPVYTMDVGSCYYIMGDTLHTKQYFNEAMSEIQKSDKKYTYIDLVCEMLGFYAFIDDKSMADSCMAFIKRYNRIHPVNYNANLADYYEVYGPIDSAIHYNELDLKDSKNIIARKDATRGLMKIYRQSKQYEKASYYSELYAEATDSFYHQLMSEQTMNAHNMYFYRRDVMAEAETYRKASETKQFAIIIVSIAIILLLIGIILYVLYRQRMEHELEREKNTINTLKHQKRQLSNQLVHKSASIKEAQIMHSFRLMATKQRHSSPSDTEWSQLIAFVNSHNNGFTHIIYELYPTISDIDLRITYLIKLGFTNIEIENIMNMTHTTAYRHISKLKTTINDIL